MQPLKDFSVPSKSFQSFVKRKSCPYSYRHPCPLMLLCVILGWLGSWMSTFVIGKKHSKRLENSCSLFPQTSRGSKEMAAQMLPLTSMSKPIYPCFMKMCHQLTWQLRHTRATINMSWRNMQKHSFQL